MLLGSLILDYQALLVLTARLLLGAALYTFKVLEVASHMQELGWPESFGCLVAAADLLSCNSSYSPECQTCPSKRH